jgi:hypothetical protein
MCRHEWWFLRWLLPNILLVGVKEYLEYEQLMDGEIAKRAEVEKRLLEASERKRKQAEEERR